MWRQDGAAALSKSDSTESLTLAVATKDDGVTVFQEGARFAIGEMNGGLAALSQANQSSQAVLSLLR